MMKFLSFINFWLVTCKNIVFWGLVFIIFPFRVSKMASLIAIIWLKKELRVILDIFLKDQIIPRFSEFDLDLDQDHQI